MRRAASPATSTVRIAAALAVASAGLACGPGADAPRLENLRCADPDDCQSREDPFLLLLAVDFEDADGDLGAGTFTVFVDGEVVDGPHPLVEPFEAAALPLGATAGTLVLPAGLQLSPIHSGMDFVVGIEVEDGSGNRSNRPGIVFRLDFH